MRELAAIRKWLLLLVAVGLFPILYLNGNWIFASAMVVWLLMMAVFLGNWKENSAMLAFLIAFYAFLLGREVQFFYFGLERYYIFSEQIENHAYLCLFISLIGVAAGAAIYAVSHRPAFAELQYAERDASLRLISKRLFYILYIPYIAELLFNISRIQSQGYLASYQAANQASAPIVIRIFGGTAPMAFYLFLAAMPTKREARIPILLYLLYGGLSLMGGARTTAVTTALFLVVYYVIRQRNGDHWISRWHIITAVVAVPLVLAGLETWDYIRREAVPGTISLFRMAGKFFEELGGSINVIKRMEYYADQLPKARFYSISGLRELLLENGFAVRLFGATSYSGNSVEHALYGHSLAHSLSYLVYGDVYLAGRGIGSSFIAELYHDFGYVGIFAGSALYGWILKKISAVDFRDPYWTAILFAMIPSFLMAPRAGFDSFLSGTFSIRSIFTLCLTVIIIRSLVMRVWRPAASPHCTAAVLLINKER